MTDTLKAVAGEELAQQYRAWLQFGIYAKPAVEMVAKLVEAVEEMSCCGNCKWDHGAETKCYKPTPGCEWEARDRKES